MGNTNSTPELRSSKEKFLYLHQQLTTLKKLLGVGFSYICQSDFSTDFTSLNRLRRRYSPNHPGYSASYPSVHFDRVKRISPNVTLWRKIDPESGGSFCRFRLENSTRC